MGSGKYPQAKRVLALPRFPRGGQGVQITADRVLATLTLRVTTADPGACGRGTESGMIMLRTRKAQGSPTSITPKMTLIAPSFLKVITSDLVQVPRIIKL